MYCFEGSIEEDPFERPYGAHDPYAAVDPYVARHDDIMYGCPDYDYSDLFYEDDEEDLFDGCCDDRDVYFPIS